MYPHSSSHLISEQGVKTIQSRKDNLFHNGAKTTGHPNKKIYIQYQKINPKWITDLNIKYKTIKLPEGKISKSLLSLTKTF